MGFKVAAEGGGLALAAGMVTTTSADCGVAAALLATALPKPAITLRAALSSGDSFFSVCSTSELAEAPGDGVCGVAPTDALVPPVSPRICACMARSCARRSSVDDRIGADADSPVEAAVPVDASSTVDIAASGAIGRVDVVVLSSELM